MKLTKRKPYPILARLRSRPVNSFIEYWPIGNNKRAYRIGKKHAIYVEVICQMSRPIVLDKSYQQAASVTVAHPPPNREE